MPISCGGVCVVGGIGSLLGGTAGDTDREADEKADDSPRRARQSRWRLMSERHQNNLPSDAETTKDTKNQHNQ